MKEILADTGPLVAYLDRSDRDHEWAKEAFSAINRPLLTCEAVIAEALFLLRRGGIDPGCLLELIRRGLLVPKFDLAKEIDAIQQLMKTSKHPDVIGGCLSGPDGGYVSAIPGHDAGFGFHGLSKIQPKSHSTAPA